MQRTSGLILHPSSLPAPGGIGTLGAAARDFVDFLAAAEQTIWQVLPLGPTGLGDSPYMTTSAFAGNPLLIDLVPLVEAGWLAADQLADAPSDTDRVDFEAVIGWKRPRLQAAFDGFRAHAGDEAHRHLAAFRAAHGERWLDDFALFTALFERHQDVWTAWPAPVRDRDAAALDQARTELADAIERVVFEQWLFREQWQAVRGYANARGIQIVGDIPIFVAFHSSDVWANPELFYLGDDGQPTVIAGVPPDYFAETGQRWGNPLYRWERMAETGYAWWIERFRGTLELVDQVRVDHFRGFVAYWEIPAHEETAVNGRWRPGPGRALFDSVRQALGDLPIIAEDLGEIDQPVYDLRDALGFPGMKVLHFAFLDGDAHNLHLPHNHVESAVVYTGTHDNDTTVGFYEHTDDGVRDWLRSYLGVDGQDIAWQLMTAAWRSVARLALAPAQDVLSLGQSARMNTPGEAEGNWSWRLWPGQLDGGVAGRLRAMTRRYGRSPTTSHWK